MLKICRSCREEFDADAEFKTQCIPCFKHSKGYARSTSDTIREYQTEALREKRLRLEAEKRVTELEEQLSKLSLQYCSRLQEIVTIAERFFELE